MKKYEDTTVNVLAKEVAKVFGGEHVELDRDGGFYESFAKVIVPAFDQTPGYELNMRISNFGADKGRVTVSLYPTRTHRDVTTREAGLITVNSARGAQAICADISKRLVNKGDVIEKLRSNDRRVDEAEARDGGLAGHLEALRRDCPNVMTVDHFPASGGSVRLFARNTAASLYFNATLYANGAVGFDRIGNVSPDQAKRIFAILAEG